jgi:hypothetical protein
MATPKAPERRCYRCGSTDAASYLPLYTWGLLICGACYGEALWYSNPAPELAATA